MIPLLSSEAISAEGLVWNFVVPTELPFFEGHFPGHPILPGVVALGWLLAAMERFTGQRTGALEVLNAKFQVVILPGAALELTVVPKAGGGCKDDPLGGRSARFGLDSEPETGKCPVRANARRCAGFKTQRHDQFFPALACAVCVACAVPLACPAQQPNPAPAVNTPATRCSARVQVPAGTLPFTMRLVFHRLAHDRAETIPFAEVRTFAISKNPLRQNGTLRSAKDYGLSLSYESAKPHVIVVDDKGLIDRQPAGTSGK